MTDIAFVSAVNEPDHRTEPALFFAFKEDRLLVRRQGASTNVPCLLEFSELRVPTVSQHYLGRSGERHIYAVELDDQAGPPSGMALHGLREIYDHLDDDLFWLAARAVQIVAWAKTHRYCSQCGSKTGNHERDRAMVCGDCGLQSFPRLSPAIIVLVQREDRMLLARSPRFPKGRYSVIAGFVEPGETLEEAVAREVLEEVSIEVEDIRYFGSQPWPFPNSLMLGFTAKYAGGEIRIDEDEIEDAGWYSADQLPDLPDAISISRKLIDWFLSQHKR